LLRSLGVLEEHAARNETAATQMFRELDAVRRTLPARQPPSPVDPTEFGPTTTAAWQRWLDTHGHRGIYESDLSRPRYVEQPAPVLSALRSALDSRTPPPRSPLGALTWPIWLASRRPMTAREAFRSDSMRSFLAVRRELLRHAEAAGLEPEALWLLETTEVRQLDDGWRPTGALLAQRRADTDRRRANPIPDFIRRFDPPDRGSQRPGSGEPRTEFHGLGLVAASAEGLAWVLNEPAHELPDGFDAATTILVAPSVDPGWISTFGLVNGVAIELGGDLSHGSILLRELGLAAVTNARGLTAHIATGDRVRVDGRRGLVQIIR
jgi:pyruvate,water dikinase